MIPLLSQSEILVFLFDYMKQQGRAEGMTPTLSAIRKSLNSPDFDSIFFNKIKNPDLTTNDILEIMNTYKISPEIDQNELQRFSDQIENFNKVDMMLYVVYFYIAWLIIPNNNTNVTYQNSFGIELLNLIVKIDEIDHEINYKSLYLSVEFYIIQSILTNNDIIYFDQVKLIIFMLFNKHKLSEEYTFLLGLAIKTITSTNPDSISVDDVKFLTILHIYYISNGRNVPIKTTQLIYCSLTPLIYNLDNFVLKFITEISKEVPETISILAVNLFPSAILQEIQRSNLSYEINIENIPIFEPIKRNNHEEVIMQFSTQKNINF